MRSPDSPPAPGELVHLDAHVVVRDYPETLEIFRAFGVSLPQRGGESVAAVMAAEAGPLLDALVEGTAWRRAASR